MKRALIAGILSLPLCMAIESGTATAAEQEAAHAPTYSSADTLLGDLLDNPAALAILDKYLPGLSKGDQIDMARGMTLKQIQPYAPDLLTDEALAKVDADLAKLSIPDKPASAE